MIQFIKTRQVKNPIRNVAENAGIDFFIPENTEDFIEALKKKNSGILELSTFINNSLCNDIGYFITIPRNLSNYYSSKYINIVKIAFEKSTLLHTKVTWFLLEA